MDNILSIRTVDISKYEFEENCNRKCKEMSEAKQKAKDLIESVNDSIRKQTEYLL